MLMVKKFIRPNNYLGMHQLMRRTLHTSLRPVALSKNYDWVLLQNFRLKENNSILQVKCSSKRIITRHHTTTTHEQSIREPKREIGFMGWFLLFVPIATFCLGTWQVKRRKWKLELMQALHSKTTAEPIDLPDDLQEINSLEYCPVRVRGEFDHSREILLGPRSLLLHGDAASQGGLISPGGGQSGALVITPFKLADRNFEILVQRGWVPTSHKDASTRVAGQVEGEVELVGIVRLAEKRAPFVPQNKPGNAVANSTVPKGPIGGQTRVTLRNEHMSYIFTW
ncbi:hypothetical protein B566_EDAN002974 [Ephemera danica]|nr:hypothetical protein B566_EDAN002974 [Ephemera danica]